MIRICRATLELRALKPLITKTNRMAWAPLSSFLRAPRVISRALPDRLDDVVGQKQEEDIEGEEEGLVGLSRPDIGERFQEPFNGRRDPFLPLRDALPTCRPMDIS